MTTEKEDYLTRKYRNMGMSWREVTEKVDRIKSQEELGRSE